MLLKRKQAEEREKAVLAGYAAFSGESRGRAYAEPEDPFRTAFQRDRDRIIHSKAFRRLKGKTQVFVAHYGDHYRSRLAHSMEVAQLSRDVARMLNLNEDLAEAIGLAHDLGHTPFAHAGQDEMHRIMQQYGGRFEHNEQSRRVVDVLEDKKPEYQGLNLTFEVRDGLIKHRTTFDQPEMLDTLMPSIEAQIVNVADEIAYMNHDIDDGLRSGILHFDDMDHLALWQQAKTRIDLSLSLEYRIPAMISALISLMVDDLANNTNHNIEQFGIHVIEDVYKTSESIGCFSPAMVMKADELKQYLFDHFYTSPGVAEYNLKGQEVIHFLFDAFYKKPELLPEKLQELLPDEPKHVVVKDYIAGMTDNFALELYSKLHS